MNTQDNTNQENTGFFTTSVMLVDDSSIDNFINQRIISSYRFAEKMEVFKNPVQAIERLRELDASGRTEDIPAYIFLDINMPQMDGYEFVDEFNKMSERMIRRCRIIVLSSAVSTFHTPDICYRENVMACLSKPLIKSNLEELVSLSYQYEKVKVAV